MESLELLKTKLNWAYDLDDIIKLVENKQITEQDFKNITGYNYKGIQKSREIKKNML